MTETRPVAADPRRPPVPTPVLVGAVVVTVVGAVLASGEPTGLTAVDGFWRVLVAVVFVLAASRARPWSLVPAAAVALWGAEGAWIPVAALALAGAAWTALDRRAPRWPSLLVAAAVVQVLLRLEITGGFGAESLVVALVIVPLIVSGYRHAPPAPQRAARLVGLAASGFVLLAVAGFGVAALTARGSFHEAINAGEAGVSALEDGDDARAAEDLQASASAFGAAQDRIEAPWAQPARLVPVLAQHVDATTTLAASAIEVADTAAASLRAVPYQELRPIDGRVDLARLEEATPLVEATTDALERAVVASSTAEADGWLLRPVADRLERVTRDLDDKLGTGRRTEAAVRVVPGLLGAEGPRRYLVLFGTPAESRGLGGFAGAYGVLTADAGRVELETTGRTVDLAASGGTPIEVEEYLQRYGALAPAQNLGNVTASPDFPSVAAVASQVFPAPAGADVAGFDGVLYVDPYGLAALLSITGAVEVPGLPFALDQWNAAPFLLTDQYVSYPDVDERTDLLADVARATFDRLVGVELPGPKAITDALAPAVEDGRLRFVAFDDPEAEAFLDEIGLARAFPRPDGGDLVAPRTANANPNKIDAFLHRTIDYRVRFDPDSGATEATAEITLRNDAPASGLPGYVIGNRDVFGGPTPAESAEPRPVGSNTLDVTWYGPLLTTTVEVDGRAVPVQSQRELGWWAHTVTVTIPAGEARTVRFGLAGFLVPDPVYRVRVDAQPLVHADAASLVVEGAPSTVTVVGGPDPVERVIGS